MDRSVGDAAQHHTSMVEPYDVLGHPDHRSGGLFLRGIPDMVRSPGTLCDAPDFSLVRDSGFVPCVGRRTLSGGMDL